MYSKYDFIKDLNPTKEDWRIKLRVVRCWKVPSLNPKDFDDNVDMVLLDEQVRRIHATAKDIIGLLSGIGEVREHVISGRITRMVVVELDNLRLSGDPIESSQRLTQLSSQSSYSFENDFLKDIERKFITDIKNCSDVTTCITYGSIKSIESKYNWWYKFCKKCPYSVCEDFEKLYCKNCQKHWDEYYPKFSVQVRVVDNSDSASFVLFDRDCLALLGVSAGELREQHFKRGADLEHYPEELNVVKDRSMLFKVNVKISNLNAYREPKYHVAKVCIIESIITSFLKTTADPNDDSVFDSAYDDNIVSIGSAKAMDVQSQTCESTGDADISLSTPSVKYSDVVEDKNNCSVVRPLKKIKLEKDFDAEAGDTLQQTENL
ncbi:uncharacterized protein LOC133302982 [Gastrolobium bilobum]|uniref:uncharacterized protein LOC133302982 n=1 Tax=Gastrolobium bilobum TaxID=150636 RepID=UPI002AB2D1A9|nr:uncharacterized protein LOC133302982 [Gastrolobium bilobum]